MHTLSAQDTHALRPTLRARLSAGMSLTELALRSANYLQVWRQRAQGRRQLVHLNDHLLRDIGLTRHEAEKEYSKPFWQA